ncbi:MAG: tRNA lysidine(34) synthetase TilS, partial [Gammaproteobacteria bacterium]|nr:tRNA lysidine(34) synthetase TilS [Gammaproteobacteria bacterium]
MAVVEEPLVRLLGDREFSRLLVGYSGGLDSTVLLHAVRSAWPEAELVALHVNHGLQPQSLDWEDHCVGVCQRLNVELITVQLSLEVEGNLEAAARTARYQFFSDQLNSNDILLLAHHRFDQAETILLRLVQGRGLIGMPEERSLGRGVVLRPFLDTPRGELEAYAQHHTLSWTEDPSNRDIGFDRNYLRQRVLPELRARWPTVDVSLSDLANRRRQLDAVLVDLAGLSTGHELELAVLERHP